MKKKLQDRPHSCVQLFSRTAWLMKIIGIILLTSSQSFASVHFEKISLNNIQKEVHGKVTNAAGEPLEGATVSVLNSTISTITNKNGAYSLSVPDNAILSFFYVGYELQKVTVGNQSEINVSLKSSTQALKEV